MPTLHDLGEIEVLRRLMQERGAAEGVVVGPGDDAAVLEPSPGARLVVTTDAFVEERHYMRAWSTPQQVGVRLAAANLSDLAAMAARPRWALLSIGARRESEVETLVGVQHGAQESLRRWGAGIVGGNLTAVTGAEWFSLTLLGEAQGMAWTRSGARDGDLLAVTGQPGRAAAGWALARRLGKEARTAEWQPLLDAWLAPEPRVALALELSRTGAVHAAIDISDGLAGALAQMCEASGVGVEVDAAWPEDELLARAATALGTTHDALRFGPSDDYELVLAVDPADRAACEGVAAKLGVPFTTVGRFTSDRQILVRDESGKPRPLDARGYDAFDAES